MTNTMMLDNNCYFTIFIHIVIKPWNYYLFFKSRSKYQIPAHSLQFRVYNSAETSTIGNALKLMSRTFWTRVLTPNIYEAHWPYHTIFAPGCTFYGIQNSLTFREPNHTNSNAIYIIYMVFSA